MKSYNRGGNKMIYKCPGCGGALTFEPMKQKMHCKFCDKFYFQNELENEKEPDDIPANSIDVYVYSCTSCGAELMVNKNEASTFCAHCGQPTVVFNRVSKELKPDFCIPFGITGEQAVKLIRQKLSKGRFVPDEIQNVTVDKLRGIYIPFWLYDIKIRAKANINGTRGSGKTQRKVYYYRDAEAIYKRIPCDGSAKLSDELSQRLEPYDMDGLRRFEPNYLSGFYADRFDVTEKESRAIAAERAIKFLEDDILESVGPCDNKNFEDKNVKYDFLEHSYALFPAWFMTFWYQNELYTILLNGQTGKVVGNVPISKKKVLKLVSWLTPLLIAIMSAISVFAISFLNEEFLLKTGFAAVFLIGAFMVGALSSWNRCLKERKFFMSSNTIAYVKERQDNE